jgi:hypothetical protein
VLNIEYIEEDEYEEPPITKAFVEKFEHDKDRLDGLVSTIFSEYCAANNFSTAYGVESWEIYGGALKIKQDTSCRGCYSSEQHSLDAAYIYMTQEERQAEFARIKDEKARNDALAARAQQTRELAQIEARAAVLREKLSPSS